MRESRTVVVEMLSKKRKSATNSMTDTHFSMYKSVEGTSHSRGTASHGRDKHVLHKPHLLSVVRNARSWAEYTKACHTLQEVRL